LGGGGIRLLQPAVGVGDGAAVQIFHQVRTGGRGIAVMRHDRTLSARFTPVIPTVLHYRKPGVFHEPAELGWRRTGPTQQTECGTKRCGKHPREGRVEESTGAAVRSAHKEVSWLADRLASSEEHTSEPQSREKLGCRH